MGIFGLTHSLLAAEWWKLWVAQRTGVYFPYYRLLYSLIVFFQLIIIIVYELQLPALWLWRMPLVVQLVAGIAALAGLLIMGICIRRYFYYLSGIDVLLPPKPITLGLSTSGLHRYVRHPLYSGTLLAVWSFFLLFPELGYLISCSLITLYTCIGVLWEEQRLRKEFGEVYLAYQQKVPMLIPFKLGKAMKTSSVQRQSRRL
ncbi:isoprenylcysteine carboxylmethyltransferase family protein [Paraflavitalea speifideaquila]|uniref:methyltransferase family protein n=1 Tax=Paraflavitalea speifideaquila TaxID=3076558 RepID=UPI0028E67E75|nr:isoprenylcysteine carboxylmethyltransferase family protein [Paraflavitalea speifideiaquila]